MDADKEEKAHTEGRVSSLKKKLKRAAKHGKELLNYFEVVCNPESFSVVVVVVVVVVVAAAEKIKKMVMTMTMRWFLTFTGVWQTVGLL